MPKRKPIRDIDEFVRVHDEMTSKMIAYFHTERGRKVSKEIKTIFFDKRPSLLYATNVEVRKAVASASKEVLEQPDTYGSREYFFVTIAFDNHWMGLSGGVEFDVDLLKSWAQSTFSTFDYFGIIEVSYFTNTQIVNPDHSEMLSWHCHLIVWNITPEEIRDIKNKTKKGSATFRPEAAPVHFKKIGRDLLIEQVIYMLKNPVNSYRLVPVTAEIVDPETGEITRVKKDKTAVKKRPLRQCEVVRVFSALGQRTIDKLMFAGGQGKKIKREIIDLTKSKLGMK